MKSRIFSSHIASATELLYHKTQIQIENETNLETLNIYIYQKALELIRNARSMKLKSHYVLSQGCFRNIGVIFK